MSTVPPPTPPPAPPANLPPPTPSPVADPGAALQTHKLELEIQQLEQATSKWILLERAKKGVEIIAIVIAGLWALKLYRETDVPAQEKRPSIQSELKWTANSKESCLAEYTVTFKNVGKTSIDLGSPTLKVWVTDQPKLNGQAEYLDPHALIANSPQFEQRLTNEEYANHYPPDVGDTVTMTTIVKRNPGRILMFAVDFPQRDPDAPHFLDYRWGYACDEPLTERESKKKPH
jgi:hypothetical protein